MTGNAATTPVGFGHGGCQLRAPTAREGRAGPGRYWCAHGLTERWYPLTPCGWLVVADVHRARRPRQGLHGSRRRVVDMDEAGDVVVDDQTASAGIGRLAAPRLVPRIRPVEHAVTLHDPFGGLPGRLLQRGDRVDGCPPGLGGAEVQRCRLAGLAPAKYAHAMLCEITRCTQAA